MAELTFDTFLSEHLSVAQNKTGYRFSIDAVILACHTRQYTAETVIDLGTGCGIIPLIMCSRNPSLRIIGIELQKGLAELAQMNVFENRMSSQVSILCQDLKTLNQKMVGGAVDLIVSNPPYRKVVSGRLSTNTERALARHEISATLDDIASCAGRMLRTCGKFVAIYPAERLSALMAALQKYRIEPKTLRTIHSKPNSPAKLVLVEGSKRGQPGMQIAAPLYIYQNDGRYTEEMHAMFTP